MEKIRKEAQNLDAKDDIVLENFDEDQAASQDFGQVMAAWDFPEYFKYQRGRSWYMFFSLAIVALMIYAFVAKNWLFAGVIVIGLIVYIISESRPPLYIRIMLTEDGVLINHLPVAAGWFAQHSINAVDPSPAFSEKAIE